MHASVDGWRARDLRVLVTSAARTFLAGTTGVRYWFLDEVSSIPDGWPQVIKSLRDTDVQFSADTVVLTGSSAAGLHDARKALAGRRGDATDTDRTLLPMRFVDVVAAAGLRLPEVPRLVPAELSDADGRAAVQELLPYLSDLVDLWESYLRIGGFPQAVTEWLSAGDVEAPLVDALWDVVYGDAIEASRFSALQTLTLLDRLSANLCSPLNISDLARDLDVGREAADARLADLTESFLAWPCHREQGMCAHLASQRKWYFTDPLLARLASLRGLGREPDLTQLSQQQVGLALLRTLDGVTDGRAADFDRLMYYRSASRTEIDFVARQMDGVAVESKYVDDGWTRDLQTVTASPWRGILASRSGLEWRDQAVVIPAAFLAVLLHA